MLIVYGGIPHDNGVFSFYRALRAGLKPLGHEVLCVSMGDEAKQKWNPQFVDDGCVNLEASSDLKKDAQNFVQWCGEKKVDVVIPQHVPQILAALPHLQSSLRVVHVCMDLFPEALDFYRRIWPYVDCMVAATPRQKSELLNRHVPQGRLGLIPFAAQSSEFSGPNTASSDAPIFEIAWVARLNHHQKGVRWVPGILDGLKNYRLHVVGEGHDREWLERAGLPLVMHGRKSPAQVAQILRQCHAYLLPTRYEGFGISIIEAMMSGCVPVVTRLSGVTDSIITHGRDGLLCRLGSRREFADALNRLNQDRKLLRQLQTQAVATATQRFSTAALGESYNRLLQDTLATSCKRNSPIGWDQFDPAATAYDGFKRLRWIPGRIVRYWLDWREIRLSRTH